MTDIKLQMLRYLVALADTRHFGRAARRCFVSQPTLSTQVRKLEAQLGVSLIERRGRQVMLTDAGQDIVRRARGVLGEVDQIVETARYAQDSMVGRLRIGLIPTLGPYLLPHVLGELRGRYPRLQLLLAERQTDVLLAELGDGTLDAAVLALPVDVDGLEVRALFTEHFLVAMPPDHRLAARAALDVEDLDGEELLLLEDGHCLRDQALEVCSRVVTRERQDFRATSLETLRQMVAAGGGITLLPALAVENPVHNTRLAVRPFRAPAPARSIGAVWRTSSPRRATLDTVAGVIAAVMRRDKVTE
ncbi:MAG TPA: LysR substrate-binding domain-containing protein [Gammaproteobacteria bacterium]|nr:LysR substrate-binding domain-containing protein [Gammaproteobacteria bacterium]